MIRVFVVDDFQAIRTGVKAILQESQDIYIVGEASNYQEAILGCQSTKPDIALVDINLSDEKNGIELAEEILSKLPGTKIIFLTAFKDCQIIKRSMEAGASGFITQAALTSKKLTEAIRTAISGGFVIDEDLTKKLFSENNGSCLSKLTRRERQVLELLSDGLANKQIAAKLSIDPKTVRNHLNNIYTKLNINCRVQAAMIARDRL